MALPLLYDITVIMLHYFVSNRLRLINKKRSGTHHESPAVSLKNQYYFMPRGSKEMPAKFLAEALNPQRFGSGREAS